MSPVRSTIVHHLRSRAEVGIQRQHGIGAGARTDWQVIPCWRALYLQNVQPKQSQQKRKVLQVLRECSRNINIRIMKDRSSLALENRAAVIIKKEKGL